MLTFRVTYRHTIFPQLFMVSVHHPYLAVRMKQIIPRCHHWPPAPNPAVSWLILVFLNFINLSTAGASNETYKTESALIAACEILPLVGRNDGVTDRGELQVAM